jgi:hypothetical protein
MMNPKFNIGDIVYCVQGEQYILAVVIGVIFDTNQFIYHVIYEDTTLDGYWDEHTLTL